MERHWQSATLRWLSPQECGRQQAPQRPEYAATARFFGDEAVSLFSVIIRFNNRSRGESSAGSPVEIALLCPGLAEIERRLDRETGLVITEGARPVAECQLSAAPVAATP